MACRASVRRGSRPARPISHLSFFLLGRLPFGGVPAGAFSTTGHVLRVDLETALHCSFFRSLHSLVVRLLSRLWFVGHSAPFWLAHAFRLAPGRAVPSIELCFHSSLPSFSCCRKHPSFSSRPCLHITIPSVSHLRIPSALDLFASCTCISSFPTATPTHIPSAPTHKHFDTIIPVDIP